MSTIQCIIVDDEELTSILLKTYVSKIDYLHCKNTFETHMEALSYLKEIVFI